MYVKKNSVVFKFKTRRNNFFDTRLSTLCTRVFHNKLESPVKPTEKQAESFFPEMDYESADSDRFYPIYGGDRIGGIG